MSKDRIWLDHTEEEEKVVMGKNIVLETPEDECPLCSIIYFVRVLADTVKLLYSVRENKIDREFYDEEELDMLNGNLSLLARRMIDSFEKMKGEIEL